MPKVFTSKSQRTGERGEQIAVKYLKNKGFSIFERNYTKKWGEIDIIATKGDTVHFIEVKAKTIFDFKPATIDRYKPEDGMHPWKIARLKKTIQTYLLERDVKGDWQFDLVTVYLNDAKREAVVKMLDDIIL